VVFQISPKALRNAIFRLANGCRFHAELRGDFTADCPSMATNQKHFQVLSSNPVRAESRIDCLFAAVFAKPQTKL
jgi:hypothetical protein